MGLDFNCMGVIKQWILLKRGQQAKLVDKMSMKLSVGIGGVGVVLFGLTVSNAQAERLHLERSSADEGLLVRVSADALPAVLEPQFRVERSFDLQTWKPVGESLRTGAGGHVLEVNSSLNSAAFFRSVALPIDVAGKDLSGTDLSGLSLQGADFTGSDLRYADLSGSDLSGASLADADLRGADLRFANLEGVRFEGVTVNGANLFGAKLPRGFEAPGAVGVISESELGLGEIDLVAPAPPGSGPVAVPALPPVALDSGGGGGFGGFAPEAAFAAPRDSLGFAVGGANDVGNFRQNLANGFLPLPSDITYEGLFYDYFFDTGQSEVCETLFCPSYTQAITADPYSEREERYLSVGLNSGIKASDFTRKHLNLMVVVDVSGSMGSPFDRYYYDGSGGTQELSPEEQGLLKMDVAIDAVSGLLEHLLPDDRIGIVAFNSSASLVQPLSKVADLNLDDVRRKVGRLRAFSGTNMSEGMSLATRQYADLREIDPTVSENRIIFVTDAMPNQGETTRGGLVGMIETNATARIYSTVIGVGVDFNTDLIESITKNRGANYYSVHSPFQFLEQMDENFDFMVTPLVFDLRLGVQGEGWSIERVYGSPEANEATGEVLRVNTLFPSRTENGETRGGLILLKLSRNPEVDNQTLRLSASFENRVGEAFEIESVVEFAEGGGEHFDNLGIRKGVLLARYANLIADWIVAERSSYQDELPVVRPLRWPEIGIPVPPIWPYPNLGEWERRSAELFVSPKYRTLFEEFATYFEAEMKAIGDESLQQELDVLQRLASRPLLDGVEE